MNSTSLDDDIDLFKAAADLMGVSRDRRRHPRHKYDAFILVGPYVQGNQPECTLLPVRCNDLSESGISFYSQRLDDARLILVQLNLSQPVSLVARVMRQAPVDSTRFAHLIGCQFIGRPS